MMEQKGFTAVEVLVTLFIATTLLLGGYQAYTAVVGSASEGRQQGIASNIAYENLRRESGAIGANCSNQSAVDLSSRIPGDVSLSEPYSMSKRVSCPFGTSSPISKIQITLTYGPDNQKVSHAIYSR